MTSTKKSNILTVKIIFIIFLFLKVFPAFGQAGCTDPSANNYDPSATVNDGSCTYNETFYTPPVIVDTISDILKESSGLQWVNNSLWSFNDRGGTPDLYRIDTASKAILQTVRLGGATNVDWEEVSYDGTYFYVGDFGNNLNGFRKDLKIYKFPYSLIPDYTTNPDAAIDSAKIEVINFTYSDQKDTAASPLDSTKFDCEAMIVSGGKIHLFTKDWIDYTSTHYVINSTHAGTYVATPADTLNTGYLVTAASKAPDKEFVVLLGYIVGNGSQPYISPGNHYMHLLSDYSNGKYFNGNKRKINLPTASEMGQAEGITFRNDDYGYISNERFKKSIGPVDIISVQKLRSFSISSFAPSNILALDLTDFTVNKINADDRIAWSFSVPVHNVQIQQSFDGVHFTALKTYSISAKGSFNNKPVKSTNYYRIAWMENNGATKFSKIISIKNEENNQVSNVLLKATGELSFVLNGNQEKSFSFKLLTIDGKELSQLRDRSYKPGFNKVNFAGGLALKGVVVLTGISSKEKITMLLPVAK